GRLATLRDEVQRTVKRFELENQGLDAVSQRILDLRGGLTDMETRFRSLDESSRAITDVRSKADGLTTQLSGITESMAQLETQAERVRAVEANAGRLGETVEAITRQVARLEKAKAAMEAALQDGARPKATHGAPEGAPSARHWADSSRSGAAGCSRGWTARTSGSRRWRPTPTRLRESRSSCPPPLPPSSARSAGWPMWTPWSRRSRRALRTWKGSPSVRARWARSSRCGRARSTRPAST